MPSIWRRTSDLRSQIRGIGIFLLALLLLWSELTTRRRTVVSPNKAALSGILVSRMVTPLLAGHGGEEVRRSVCGCSVVKKLPAGRGGVGEWFRGAGSFTLDACSFGPHVVRAVGGVPNCPRLPRSGRRGRGWRWGTRRSGAPGVFHEASTCEVHQQWRGHAAASSGQGGHFAPESSILCWLFFLQARVPSGRIFISPGEAPHAGITPNGLVPGGVPGGRRTEILRRWRKMTRLLSLVSSEVLFRIHEELTVIYLYVWFSM